MVVRFTFLMGKEVVCMSSKNIQKIIGLLTIFLMFLLAVALVSSVTYVPKQEIAYNLYNITTVSGATYDNDTQSYSFNSSAKNYLALNSADSASIQSQFTNQQTIAAWIKPTGHSMQYRGV